MLLSNTIKDYNATISGKSVSVSIAWIGSCTYCIIELTKKLCPKIRSFISPGIFYELKSSPLTDVSSNEFKKSLTGILKRPGKPATRTL